jgi:hypothetical protein
VDQVIEFLTWIHDKAPALIGWGIAAVVGWRVYADAAKGRITNRDVLVDYQNLVHAYHVAVLENAKVTERLALLISERTASGRSRPPRD